MSVICEKCGKEFKHEMALKIHMGRAHKVAATKSAAAPAPRGEMTCAICGRSFHLAAHLGRHMAAAHKKGKSAKRGRRMVRAAAPAAPARQSRGISVDVTDLTVDQLLALKSAVDIRLGAIVRRMRQAKVKV
jgi:hypothetical protein